MVQTRTEPEPQVQFRVRPYGPNRTRSSVRGSEILCPEPNRTELFHHYTVLSNFETHWNRFFSSLQASEPRACSVFGSHRRTWEVDERGTSGVYRGLHI